MGEEERPPRDLKQRINNLLWEILPNETTMGDAEILALNIYRDIASFLGWGVEKL